MEGGPGVSLRSGAHPGDGHGRTVFDWGIVGRQPPSSGLRSGHSRATATVERSSIRGTVGRQPPSSGLRCLASQEKRRDGEMEGGPGVSLRSGARPGDGHGRTVFAVWLHKRNGGTETGRVGRACRAQRGTPRRQPRSNGLRFGHSRATATVERSSLSGFTRETEGRRQGGWAGRVVAQRGTPRRRPRSNGLRLGHRRASQEKRRDGDREGPGGLRAGHTRATATVERSSLSGFTRETEGRRQGGWAGRVVRSGARPGDGHGRTVFDRGTVGRQRPSSGLRYRGISRATATVERSSIRAQSGDSHRRAVFAVWLHKRNGGTERWRVGRACRCAAGHTPATATVERSSIGAQSGDSHRRAVFAVWLHKRNGGTETGRVGRACRAQRGTPRRRPRSNGLRIGAQSGDSHGRAVFAVWLHKRNGGTETGRVGRACRAQRGTPRRRPRSNGLRSGHSRATATVERSSIGAPSGDSHRRAVFAVWLHKRNGGTETGRVGRACRAQRGTPRRRPRSNGLRSGHSRATATVERPSLSGFARETEGRRQEGWGGVSCMAGEAATAAVHGVVVSGVNGVGTGLHGVAVSGRVRRALRHPRLPARPRRRADPGVEIAGRRAHL